MSSREAKRPDTVWQSATLSRTFLTGVRGAIPLGAEQIAFLLRLIRGAQPRPRAVLDLGCGDGVLGRAILSEFSEASAVFLDFSEPMLAAARRKARRRSDFVLADLADAHWTRAVRGSFDVIVSGFAIHHLTDRRKRRLYAEVFARLNRGGIFLNLEHVSSVSLLGETVFNELCVDSLCAFHPDKSRRAVATTYYNRPDKAANILAPVERQCRWLRRIGFADVDCFFKIGELALFGGVRR